jgi:hypothetical protein
VGRLSEGKSAQKETNVRFSRCKLVRCKKMKQIKKKVSCPNMTGRRGLCASDAHVEKNPGREKATHRRILSVVADLKGRIQQR